MSYHDDVLLLRSNSRQISDEGFLTSEINSIAARNKLSVARAKKNDGSISRVRIKLKASGDTGKRSIRAAYPKHPWSVDDKLIEPIQCPPASCEKSCGTMRAKR